MFIEILKYGFLTIFFATAVIGIASIPDWIKIPEWYRKKIFVALILEVVGVIIILFNQELINSGSSGVPDINITPSGWIALNESGSIVKPQVVVKTDDTTFIESLGTQLDFDIKKLAGKVIENGLSVINADGVPLGTIKTLKLKESGLFNSFETAKGEISSTENYSNIKWTKGSNGQWKKKGLFIGPFTLEVADYAEGTYYQINNKTTGKNVFDSRNSSKNLFSVDNRIIHFFEYEHVYYLLRISWADLLNDEKYVHVINVRMEPTVKVR